MGKNDVVNEPMGQNYDAPIFEQHPSGDTFPPSNSNRSIDKRVSMGGLVISSLCVTLSATKYVGSDGSDSLSLFALISGIIGAAIGALLFALSRFAPEVGKGPVMIAAAAFLSLFLTIGACIMTFRGPFIPLGNGYVSVFAAAFFSVALFIEVLPDAHQNRMLVSLEGVNERLQSADVSKRWIALCLVASVIEMIEASILTDIQDDRLPGYAVAVGVVSIVCSIALLVPAVPNDVKHYMTIFMTVWWTIGLIILTFATFTFSVTTMNGYAGTWAATISSYGMVIPFLASLMGTREVDGEYNEVGGGAYDDDGLIGADHEGFSDNSYAAGTGGAV